MSNSLFQNLVENDIKVIQQSEVSTKDGLVRTATLLSEVPKTL